MRFSADNNPLNIEDYQDIEFSILKTYPNPFNPSLNINYNVKEGGNIVINIYDIKGNLVENIFYRYQSIGNYNFVWNANHLSTGAYIVKLNIGSESYSNKVILLK